MAAARSALIIATDEYHDPKLRRLRAPVRDAEELGRVLGDRSIGDFDVEMLLNEPEPRVRRKLAQFFANRNRDDLLLVHFSCHGLKDDDGNLYFATPDTEVEHLDATAVPSEFVNRQMQRSRSRRIALFLDCCYSGAFSRGAMARAGDGVQLAERFDGQGQVVITASNSMEYAFEGDEITGAGTPSVFTTALVEGLETGAADRDGDDRVSIDELYDYVYDRVREHTPGMTPSKWTYDLQGELYVARNPKPRPVSPAELPSELREALESPLTAVRLGAITELERVITGTNVRLALAGRAALEALRDDDSRSVSTAAAEAFARAPGIDSPQPAVGVAESARLQRERVQLSGSNEATFVRPAPHAGLLVARAYRSSDVLRVVLGVPERFGSQPTWWGRRWPSPRGLVLRLSLVGAVLLLGNFLFATSHGTLFTGAVYAVGLSLGVAAAAALIRIGDVGAAVSSGALLAFGLLTAFAPETLQRLDERPPIVLLTAIAAVLAAAVVGLAAVAGVGREWRRRPLGYGRWSLLATLAATAGGALWVLALLVPYTGGGSWAGWDEATLRDHFYTDGALRLGVVAIGCAGVGWLLPGLTARYRLVVAGALTAAGVQTALYFLGVTRGLGDEGGGVKPGTWLGLGGGLCLLAAGFFAYSAAVRPEPAGAAPEVESAAAIQ